MSKASIRALVGVSVLAMVLAACGSKPAESSTTGGETSSTSTQTSESAAAPPSGESSTESSAPTQSTETSTPAESGGPSSSAAGGGNFSNVKACMVTDTGGIDDRSFNASSWKGVQDAEKDLGVQGKYLQSSSSSDYVPNINAFIQQKCNLILTVGFLMGDDTQKAAKANPNQDFAIVDYSYSPPLKNVLGLIYNTAQAGFLGGYLAAGLTKSGKVATYGGQKLPTVTIYMDGFWEGVQYYDQQNGKKVQVLGWDEKTQNGVFTNDFTDQSKGQQDTAQFASQGADIVFPVAGNVGLGSAKYAEQSGGKMKILWVDTDGCVSAPQYCNVMWGSVVKGIAPSVEKAIKEVANGSFQGGNYVGTLANNGTGLVLGKDLKSKIPQDLQTKLDQIKQEIISGKIKITSPSQPKS